MTLLHPIAVGYRHWLRHATHIKFFHFCLARIIFYVASTRVRKLIQLDVVIFQSTMKGSTGMHLLAMVQYLMESTKDNS